jgi:DNA-binding transcriptional regulator GbsR (MarR family)
MRTSLDKVKDYAYMTGRPFTCKQLVRDLGIGSTMAAEAIKKLCASGDIVLISSKREGIYKATSDKMKSRARAAEKRLTLITAIEERSLAEIAKERGVSRQRMHQVAKKMDIPIPQRYTQRQIEAMKQLLSGQKHGYDLLDAPALIVCAKKGMVSITRDGRFNIYELTEKGREVINAKG